MNLRLRTAALIAIALPSLLFAQRTTVRAPLELQPPPTGGSSILGTTEDIFFPNIHILSNGTENETGIAVNFSNPLQLVAVANDFSHCNGMPYNYSSDGGLTWRYGCIPRATSAGYNNAFDPTVCYDSRGNAFICYGDYRAVGSEEHQNGVFVSRSTDGGQTFQKAVGVYENLLDVNSGSGGTQPFEDKFYITADASPTSPNRDNIYVAWTHFPVAAGGTVYFSRSTDHGATWSVPISASRDDIGPQGAIPICGPNGEVYVTWSENGFRQTATLAMARSENGGLSFGAPSQIGNVQAVGVYNTTIGRMELVDKQSMRIATFPVPAVDNSNGPNRGKLYVAYQGRDNGGIPHCFIRTSSNKGVTWSSPKIVDQGEAQLDVYMPSIACDPVTGMVFLDYYDSRNSPDNTGFDLYASVSSDGFATWDEYRITSVTTKAYTLGQGTSGGNYFGDYQAMAAYNGTGWPCWWDCRDGSAYWASHIFTAQIRIGPNAVTNLAANTSCTNPAVTLTWTDPTQTTTNTPLTNFTVNIYRDAAPIGSVAKGAQTYTDTTAVSGTSYTYTVVVVAGPNTSQPAAATIIAGSGLVPMAASAFHCRPVTGGVELSWLTPSTHTDGTHLCDLAKAYVYADSTVIDSVTLTPEQVGSIVTSTIRLDTTKGYQLQVRLGAFRNGVMTLSDTTPHFFTFAGAPRAALQENFDASPVIYATGTWGLTTLKARSAPNSLTDSPNGKYTRNRVTMTYFPPVRMTQPDTTLTFAHILLDDATTEAALEITTDNGVTWNVVRTWTQANYPTEWHDSVQVSTWHVEHRSLLHTTAGAPLSDFGDTVMARFRFATAKFATGDGWYIDDVVLGPAAADAVRGVNALPAEYTLAPNAPNPFRDATTITFTLAEPGAVELTVSDMLGREVARLVDGSMSAGPHAVSFAPANLPAGSYVYALRGASGTIARQMMVVR